MGTQARHFLQPTAALSALAAALLLAACATAPAPAQSASATPAPSANAELIAAGNTVFHDNSCIACHGPEAKGTAVGPDLTDAVWLTGDGSIAAITRIVEQGVDEPKQFRSPMPAMGGANLSDEELKAVATYVWSLSHK